MKITKKGKTLITLVSIAGIATASSSGLISQLTQSLDRAMIPKVQAEESTIRNLQQRAIPIEEALAKFEAVRIAIKDGRATVVDQRGNHQALRDGVYQLEDFFLVIERGLFIGYFEQGTDTLFDGDDDGEFIDVCLLCSGMNCCETPDDVPEMSVEEAWERRAVSISVEGALERARPSQETERPLPSGL